MLVGFFVNKAEKLLNRYLSGDVEKAQLLYQHAGKTMCIDTQLITAVTMKIHADHVQLITADMTEADVTVSGNPLALMQMLLSDAATLPKEVTVKGDVALAQEIKHAMREIDLDWEEYLSKFLGDPLAHGLMKKLHKVKKWKKKVKASVARSTREYLQEETQCLPQKHEVHSFVQAVDELRDHVERLQARMERLSS